MTWNNDFTYSTSKEQQQQSLAHVNYPRQPPPGSNSTPAYPASNLLRDLSSVDDDATLRLRSTAKPLGDLCDCLSSCRHSFGLAQTPNLRLLSERHKQRLPCGVIWFVRDCCGVVCLVFTWLLLLFAEFVVAMVILPRSPSPYFSWIAGSIYHVFAFLAGMSHIKSFATNPGAIPIGNATSDAVSYINELHGDTYPSIIRCPKCLCIKPPRAHHCRMCGRCIRKMDHHCPWINNCVGEGNQKYFVLFTFYICLQSFFAIYVGCHFIFQCVKSDWDLCHVNPNSWFSFISYDFSPFASCAFIFGMIMEAFVFGLFTLVMCISQICSIADDETGIESLKKNSGHMERYSRRKNLTISCGSPFSWRWFSPFCPPPPLTPVFPGLIGSDVLPIDWTNPGASSHLQGNNGFISSSSSSRRTVVSL